MKSLALIPARIGSKRLPKKNLKLLGNVSLVEHTIRQALSSKCLHDIILSTDSEEIAELASAYERIKILNRPSYLAGDEVRNIDVMLHALSVLEMEAEVHYDLLVLLQPTSPFRRGIDIDRAIEMISEQGCESVVGVRGPYKKRDPILKKIIDKELLDYCDQDAPFYIQNAAIYAIRRDAFCANKSFVKSRSCPLVMDELSSIDIDTMLDFEIAEALLEKAMSR